MRDCVAPTPASVKLVYQMIADGDPLPELGVGQAAFTDNNIVVAFSEPVFGTTRVDGVISADDMRVAVRGVAEPTELKVLASSASTLTRRTLQSGVTSTGQTEVALVRDLGTKSRRAISGRSRADPNPHPRSN